MTLAWILVMWLGAYQGNLTINNISSEDECKKLHKTLIEKDLVRDTTYWACISYIPYKDK